MSWAVPHDATLEAAHDQARRQAEAGDLVGARTLLEDTLAAELDLGRDHPRLAPLMVDLATIAREVGNLTEAQRHLRRAYSVVVTSAGPEHASALSIEGRLATVTHRLGEPTGAYDWHLVDVGARVLGAEHAAVRGAQHRLANGAAAQTGPSPGAPETGIHQFAARDAWPVPGRYQPSPPATSGPEDAEPPEQTQFLNEPALDPGYALAYVPSDRDPGVFDLQPGAREARGLYVVAPPPRPRQDVEVWAEPPVAEGFRRTEAEPPRPWRARGGGVALIASLGVTVVVAGAIIVIQLLSPASNGPATSATASTTAGGAALPSVASQPSATQPTAIRAAGLPPTHVALSDSGGAVTLQWRDPAAGNVPFIVAGGRLGAPSSPLQTVPAGRTTSTIYGLNSRFDYCFTIIAVYSTELIASSMRSCTHRLSTAKTS